MTARTNRRPKPFAARFWNKVDMKTIDSCWDWVAGRDRDGYGRIKLGRFDHQAHRVAWVLSVGPIPDGLCVLHRCDRPSCVNPGHLFLGTNTDNVHDKVRKGRSADQRGEANGYSKLTRTDVLAARAAWNAGESAASIARRYHVNRTTINRIVTGKRWAHLRSRLEGA